MWDPIFFDQCTWCIHIRVSDILISWEPGITSSWNRYYIRLIRGGPLMSWGGLGQKGGGGNSTATCVGKKTQQCEFSAQAPHPQIMNGPPLNPEMWLCLDSLYMWWLKINSSKWNLREQWLEISFQDNATWNKDFNDTLACFCDFLFYYSKIMKISSFVKYWTMRKIGAKRLLSWSRFNHKQHTMRYAFHDPPHVLYYRLHTHFAVCYPLQLPLANRYSCKLGFIFLLHILSVILCVICNPLQKDIHKKVNLKSFYMLSWSIAQLHVWHYLWIFMNMIPCRVVPVFILFFHPFSTAIYTGGERMGKLVTSHH